MIFRLFSVFVGFSIVRLDFLLVWFCFGMGVGF